MLPRPSSRMALFKRATRRVTWVRSSWVPLPERSLPTGAATGGRHTVVVVTTIPTPRRTVALTGAMVIILMRRLTMIQLRELTGGARLLTVRTDRRPVALLTILTQGHM